MPVSLVRERLVTLAAVTTAHPAAGPGEDLRGAARRVMAEGRPDHTIISVPAFARVGVDFHLHRSGGGTRPRDLAAAPAVLHRAELRHFGVVDVELFTR